MDELNLETYQWWLWNDVSGYHFDVVVINLEGSHYAHVCLFTPLNTTGLFLSLHLEKIPENLFSGSLERDQCHEMSWVFNWPCNAYCQQNDQTQGKYVVACAAEFLKYLWPFYGNYSSSQNSLRLIYGTE